MMITMSPLPKCCPGFDVSDKQATSTTRVAKTSDDVILRGTRVPLTSDVGAAFVSDCARNREKIFSDSQIREKYGIDSDADWNDITKNQTLRVAISLECQRRMLNTDAAREAAAKEFTKAPAALGKLLENEQISPGSRIAAAQKLRQTATPGADRPDTDVTRYVISINMGNDRVVVDSGPLHPKNKEALDGETDHW